MRRSLRRVVLGVCAVALATAAVLGYVGRGDAAGTNICPGSVCLVAVVSPHVTSVPVTGFAAFAAGRFNNDSPSTATHLNLKFSFTYTTDTPPTTGNATVQIDTTKIRTFVDGSPVAATCIADSSSVSCSFPNLAGHHHFAKLQFPFTPVTPTPLADRPTIKATLLATYGEGNDGTNDTQTTDDKLTIADGSTARGKCTTDGSSLDSVSNSIHTSSIQVTSYPAAMTDENQNLPCTAVGIGVGETLVSVPVGGVSGYIATLELPRVDGYAIVQHDVTPLPPKTTVKTLIIWESLAAFYADPVFNLKVPPCDLAGLPPSPARAGFSADTCVYDRSSLPKGGARFIMHALGSNIDPRYTP